MHFIERAVELLSALNWLLIRWWTSFPPPANEEYYQMLMINDSQPPGFDVSSYTIEEINSITSEYTLKNTVSTAISALTDAATQC